MSRINYGDNFEEVIWKMTEGHPGAATVLYKIMNSPDVFEQADALMEILALDSLGIYASDIWGLGEYVCNGQDMKIFKQISLNVRYGKLSREVLMEHIRNSKPFEKLYTHEEIKANFLNDEKLPMIEEELYNKLVTERKYHKEE